MIARQHRHGDAARYLLGGLGGGHKREVKREGHNAYTEQQNKVRQQVEARASFNHVSTALSFRQSGIE